MIKIKEPLEKSIRYQLTCSDTPCKKEDILFFDIETTGFSPEKNHIYLIGCILYEDNTWYRIQYFADTKESEKDLLLAFLPLLDAKKILIHFNGDRFDIPYLAKRAEIHRLFANFNHLHSIDIYRKIKPYKNILHLSSLKQKSLETFLNLGREDPFHGGELIELYKQYLITHDENLYHFLILHNAEDLEGMAALLSVLTYPDLFEKTESFSVLHTVLKDNIQFTVSCFNEFPVPVCFSFPLWTSGNLCEINMKGRYALLTLPFYKGTLKYYFQNYRDYYYLPLEDQAVHKSLGAYVDKKYRQTAKASNCYIKKEGIFLPAFDFSPSSELFYINYSDKTSFMEYSDALFSDRETELRYISHLLKKAAEIH